MKLVWYDRARYDVYALQHYIAQDKPEAAQRTVLSIFERTHMLALFPEMGRAGVVAGTRELVLADISMIVPYRIVDGAIHILRVYSTVRQWPDVL